MGGDFVIALTHSFVAGDMMQTLKEDKFEHTWGNVTVKLAQSHGFCWGVERAVQIAYEARKQFPEHNLWITNEIIHNPTVNDVSHLIIPFKQAICGNKCNEILLVGKVIDVHNFGCNTSWPEES
jgi:hypothetical protein